MSLTKEEALKIFKQMWTDMQSELGDDATINERFYYKREWCEENCIHLVNHCPLCDYVFSEYDTYPPYGCKYCPIDWSNLINEEDEKMLYDPSFKSYCCARYENSGTFDEFWAIKPISEILTLPEREI